MNQESQGKTKEKRTARERLHERRRREKAAEKRGRGLKAAGAAVGALGLAALVGAVAATGRGGGGGSGPAPEPIVDGRPEAPVTLTVYEDFRCPACAYFESRFRGTLHELQEAGKLKVEYHLVTLIDDNLGGRGSAYAANAAACADDEGQFREYHDVLFDHQPEEHEDAFGDREWLVELAGKVDGLDGAGFARCVRKGTHAEWVEQSNEAFLESGYNSTPTVLLEGEAVYGTSDGPLTPRELRRKVEKAARQGT